MELYLLLSPWRCCRKCNQMGKELRAWSERFLLFINYRYGMDMSTSSATGKKEGEGERMGMGRVVEKREQMSSALISKANHAFWAELGISLCTSLAIVMENKLLTFDNWTGWSCDGDFDFFRFWDVFLCFLFFFFFLLLDSFLVFPAGISDESELASLLTLQQGTRNRWR